MPGPLASHWVHASGSAPCPPQHTPLDVHKWERLRARRGVRAHKAPDASMRVLGTDTRPPLTACAFLMMFPETEEIRSPVALLLCLAMLQATERRPAATHTKGKANPSPRPAPGFSSSCGLRIVRVRAREPIPPRAGPTALSRRCGVIRLSPSVSSQTAGRTENWFKILLRGEGCEAKARLSLTTAGPVVILLFYIENN